MVFQSYALWPHMTIEKNLALPLQHPQDPQGRAEDVSSTTRSRRSGSRDLRGRYPHQLSGGQQQRVALARALVYSPTVLLLDEPLSNLDAKLREQARAWLKRLQEDLGITTVYVTHDQDEALALQRPDRGDVRGPHDPGRHAPRDLRVARDRRGRRVRRPMQLPARRRVQRPRVSARWSPSTPTATSRQGRDDHAAGERRQTVTVAIRPERLEVVPPGSDSSRASTGCDTEVLTSPTSARATSTTYARRTRSSRSSATAAGSPARPCARLRARRTPCSTPKGRAARRRSATSSPSTPDPQTLEKATTHDLRQPLTDTPTPSASSTATASGPRSSPPPSRCSTRPSTPAGVAPIHWHELPLGCDAIESSAEHTPTSTLKALADLDGWLLGPHDSAAYPEPYRSELNPSGTIRKHFGLYANMRPAKAFEGGNAVVDGTDLVIVRENTEGFYADRNTFRGTGEFMPTPDVAIMHGIITRAATERIARAAFELASAPAQAASPSCTRPTC